MGLISICGTNSMFLGSAYDHPPRWHRRVCAAAVGIDDGRVAAAGFRAGYVPRGGCDWPMLRDGYDPDVVGPAVGVSVAKDDHLISYGAEYAGRDDLAGGFRPPEIAGVDLCRRGPWQACLDSADQLAGIHSVPARIKDIIDGGFCGRGVGDICEAGEFVLQIGDGRGSDGFGGRDRLCGGFFPFAG